VELGGGVHARLTRMRVCITQQSPRARSSVVEMFCRRRGRHGGAKLYVKNGDDNDDDQSSSSSGDRPTEPASLAVDHVLGGPTHRDSVLAAR